MCVTPSVLFQSVRAHARAYTRAHTHVCTRLHVGLILQMAVKGDELELIVSQLQRQQSLYLMWCFLVKLRENVNPASRNS